MPIHPGKHLIAKPKVVKKTSFLDTIDRGIKTAEHVIDTVDRFGKMISKGSKLVKQYTDKGKR